MLTIGFPKSKKEEEYRVALLPEDLRKIKNTQNLFIEEGYSSHLGISDEEYKRYGAKIVSGAKTYLCDAVCQAKFCDGDAPFLSRQQVIFGWTHLEPWMRLTYALAELNDTVIAWELMHDNSGYVFHRNRVITGEVGVEHALKHALMLGNENLIKSAKNNFGDLLVALIGKGNVGKGAINALSALSFENIDVYDTSNFKVFKQRIKDYDMIVNAAGLRKDKNGNWIYALTMEDLEKVKGGAIVIDLGDNIKDCSLPPQSIHAPYQTINSGKALFYRIDHIPTIDPLRTSETISDDVSDYLDKIIMFELDKTLRDAILIDNGKIIFSRLGY